MKKNKLILIIGLIVVCLIITFLWLGKMPFVTSETNDPNDSLLQQEQPVDPEPVESPEAPAPVETQDTSDEPEVSAPQTITDIFLMNDSPFELTIEGATGWAAINMSLHNDASIESDIVTAFKAGQVFVILEELGDWWYVESSDGEKGWVEHKACLINLPDVIPSIVYNVTNAYSALTRSSGYEIPGVTGQVLYEAWSFNERLQRDEFIVPTLYSTSKLLSAAQQFALEAGDTIILHEAYRAHESQQRSVRLLQELMEENETVRNAIEDGPWNLNWFIATSLSNHQRGVAFDVSLGQIHSYEIMQVGNVFFAIIDDYEEYAMPTVIHELSPLAVALEKPVSSRDRDAWREVALSDTMTPGAILLQKYFDKAGFTPLASEWWHFNDLDGAIVATELGIVGSFYIEEILSFLP